MLQHLDSGAVMVRVLTEITTPGARPGLTLEKSQHVTAYLLQACPRSEFSLDIGQQPLDDLVP